MQHPISHDHCPVSLEGASFLSLTVPISACEGKDKSDKNLNWCFLSHLWLCLKEQDTFFQENNSETESLKNLSKDTQAISNRARICRSPMCTLSKQNKTELF